MPQPHKKRGRRMEGKKRKHEDGENDPEIPESSSKRRKSSIDMTDDPERVKDVAVNGEHEPPMAFDGAYAPTERAFFGMLDEQQQEFFKSADRQLEGNSFEDEKTRSDYLAVVYREADGQELKIAQSQSCSRLMERLIQLSTSTQLKNLFQKFSGNFIHLASHRFASHCCEALFLRAAPCVTDELRAPTANGQTADEKAESSQVVVSMEQLYLDVLAELEGNIGYLLTDRYASHLLRVLLLVLAGEPLDTTSRQLLHGKRKEVTIPQGAATEGSGSSSLDTTRTVPESFSRALGKLINDSVAGLDTERLRALATHPHGNPTLQLLLKIELVHFGKQRAKDDTSILRKLLPDDPITVESSSAIFINGLVYDPVGSHLVEKIVQHAPGKMFKSLYNEFFKERMPQHARSEVAGYVVCRVLERLGQGDLLEAHELLVPTVTNLLLKDRTVVVRTLIERCKVREIDTQAIAVQVDACWHGPDGFEVKKLLKFDEGYESGEEEEAPRQDMHSVATEAAAVFFARSREPIKVHFNILAQAMLLVPGSLSALIIDSLIMLDPQNLLAMAKDRIVSRTLQAALTTRNASMITTRKLIQHFYGHMGELAIDSVASHVIDCMWEGTHGLAFIRERIAEELAENEAQLRESPCGRMVWKNWKMDLYKRRRGDWIKQSKIKASNDGFQSFSELDTNKEKDVSAKTPLQLARERHAKGKDRKRSKSGHSSNSKKSLGSTETSSRPSAATAST